jgi:8-oxo-dGTP pyrophosphatase MutT (NUDIX family)
MSFRASNVNEVKDAATIILIRKDGVKRSFLIGKRGSKAAFMPSKHVFPGGAWEATDNEIDSAKTMAKKQIRLLSLEADPAISSSLAMTAVRELWEETGLRLSTKCAVKKHPKNWKRFFLEDQGPDLSGLKFFFRAVTPPGRPRRFDARFFFCEAHYIYDDLDNFSKASGELSELRWVDINYTDTLELPKITKIVISYLKDLIASNYNYAYVPFYSGGSEGLDCKRLEF